MNSASTVLVADLFLLDPSSFLQASKPSADPLFRVTSSRLGQTLWTLTGKMVCRHGHGSDESGKPAFVESSSLIKLASVYVLI